MFRRLPSKSLYPKRATVTPPLSPFSVFTLKMYSVVGLSNCKYTTFHHVRQCYHGTIERLSRASRANFGHVQLRANDVFLPYSLFYSKRRSKSQILGASRPRDVLRSDGNPVARPREVASSLREREARRTPRVSRLRR